MEMLKMHGFPWCLESEDCMMPDPFAIPFVPIDCEVNARGSICPAPLLELIRVVRAAQVWSVVSVPASDPGSTKDIPAWIEQAGQEYLGTYAMDG